MEDRATKLTVIIWWVGAVALVVASGVAVHVAISIRSASFVPTSGTVPIQLGYEVKPPKVSTTTESFTAVRVEKILPPSFNALSASTTISEATTSVATSSSLQFAYAHSIVAADGKFFIGMVRGYNNPFPSNDIIVFDNPRDLRRLARIPLPHGGGQIPTMTFDETHNLIYFPITGKNDLEMYSINPLTYVIHTIVSTTTVDLGDRPAIVTDGSYIYGITNTATSTVFKIDLSDNSLTLSGNGHIATGHSAAIGMNGGNTELYFGGGISNGFEKVDGATLRSLGALDTGTCLPTNDMAYSKIDDTSGYVYVGCELMPFGYRIKTSDLSVTKFSLPGSSLGTFVYNGSLYNVGEDGMIDVFPNLDLTTLNRYKIVDLPASIHTNSQSIEPNELLYSSLTESFYFTAWWGIPGLFRLSGL